LGYFCNFKKCAKKTIAQWATIRPIWPPCWKVMPAQFCSVRRIRTITIKNNTQTNAINATVKAPLWFVNTLSTTEKILILANFIKWKMGTIVYFSTLEDKVEGFFYFLRHPGTPKP
jgi:hypothetical protein